MTTNRYAKYIRSIATSYGLTEEGDLILWGKVERLANSGIADLEGGKRPGSKREVAILLMALKEEEERERLPAPGTW